MRAQLKQALTWFLFAFAALSFLPHATGVKAEMPGQQANATTTAPDVTKLGPQVGEKVPDFSLPDQHGQTRTLSSLMGPKGLVLVFNRSADW